MSKGLFQKQVYIYINRCSVQYIYIYIYKKRISIWREAKLRPRGVGHPMGLTGKMPRASREARGFSGTTVLFVPRPVYL